ncbi:MAG TPA: hypothetical protein V6C78_16705 [Crinalium sp.]|jgi:hypothetical protein
MGQLVDQLGNKTAGQLIKSQDWNALVTAVENVETTLTQRVDTLETTVSQQFSDINTKLNQLTSDFNTFRTAIQPLLTRYLRVTMTTPKQNFAIGELAEITARVTDLDGNLPTTPAWIDFVAAWGQLKPASGFVSVGGAGDRTISVQTNAQGIAKVLLRSEHADAFSDEDENEVAAALTTRLQVNNRSISEVLLNASTPMEAEVKGAFQVLSKEYDRRDAVSVRSYADVYYLKNASSVTGKLAPGQIDRFRTRWRDYRATVMAFAKSDSDPTTADQSSGVCSLQVTFRDWISPWIVLDYIDDVAVGNLADRFVDQFQPKITKDYRKSVDLIRKEVGDLVRDRGLIGKLQYYQGINKAMDRVTSDQTFLSTLTESVQNAVNIQQTLEATQAATLGTFGDAIAFNVFTDAAVRADTNVAGVNADIAGLQQQVGQVQQKVLTYDNQFTTLQASLSTLNGFVNTNIAELKGSFTTLQQLSDQRFTTLNGDLTTVKTNFGVLNDRTNTLLTQGTQFRQEIDGVKVQVQRFQNVDPTKIVTRDTVRGEVNNALVDNNLLKNITFGRPG